MDYYVCIQKTIDYIEERYQDQLTLSELAEVACFSPFHFHRVFQMLVGDTVMDYVRQRRLSYAAFHLLDSDKRIIDIALDCGFQSHESFNRAFKKFFGVTPTSYRNTNIHPKTIQRKAFLKSKPIIGGPFMEPKIATKPAFHVLGFGIETSVSDGRNRTEIPNFWQDYLKNGLRKQIPNPMNPNVELGICTDFNLETGEFIYMIGLETDSETEIPDGMMKRSFEEREYAVFTTPKASEESFSSSIHTTWDYIYKTWFPSSGYEHAGAVEIELYDERCWGDKDKQMDIYIPIKKQG